MRRKLSKKNAINKTGSGRRASSGAQQLETLHRKEFATQVGLGTRPSPSFPRNRAEKGLNRGDSCREGGHPAAAASCAALFYSWIMQEGKAKSPEIDGFSK